MWGNGNSPSAPMAPTVESKGIMNAVNEFEIVGALLVVWGGYVCADMMNGDGAINMAAHAPLSRNRLLSG